MHRGRDRDLSRFDLDFDLPLQFLLGRNFARVSLLSNAEFITDDELRREYVAGRAVEGGAAWPAHR